MTAAEPVPAPDSDRSVRLRVSGNASAEELAVVTAVFGSAGSPVDSRASAYEQWRRARTDALRRRPRSGAARQSAGG